MVLLALRMLVRTNFKRVTDAATNPMHGLMPGRNPVTRTRQFLEQGISLRDNIKIMMINYGEYEHNSELHEGTRTLVNLNFSQLQYKNPDVQIVCLKNVTPTPFITFYLDNGDKFYVDVEGKSQIEILTLLQKVVGKPRELIEQQTKMITANPAHFGRGYKRKCICECEGQLECSSSSNIIPLDKRKNITGKTRNLNPKKNPFGVEEMD